MAACACVHARVWNFENQISLVMVQAELTGAVISKVAVAPSFDHGWRLWRAAMTNICRAGRHTACAPSSSVALLVPSCCCNCLRVLIFDKSTVRGLFVLDILDGHQSDRFWQASRVRVPPAHQTDFSFLRSPHPIPHPSSCGACLRLPTRGE